MSLKKLKNHEFIDLYLTYTRNTESPKIMHLWSVLASASACAGRHAYLPTGIGNIYPNIYTLLVGPPGTRKSQALGYSAKLVRKYTHVRFAPDDTGGQRQGLLKSLIGVEEDNFELGSDNEVVAASKMTKAMLIDDLDSIEIIDTSTDKHCIYAAASEFITFMGGVDAQTTGMFNKIWDGEPYDYQLKNEQQTLTESLMTIAGCTTQSDIARILPAESIGQGFLSRWILCFAPKRDRKVPIDEAGCDTSLEERIGSLFTWINKDLRGDINFSKSANQIQKDMYMKDDIHISDSRFIYYTERRHTHLLKVALILAMCRRCQLIEVVDIEMADMLLKLTEDGMPDALGEFGLSKSGTAKQKMLEFLQHVNEAVTATVLYGVMSNDMSLREFKVAIMDLISKKKIMEIDINKGTAYTYIDDLSEVWEDLIDEDDKVEIV